MPQVWYIDAGGRVEGPLPGRELRARAADGRLRPTDRISPDGKKWAPAEKVKGLEFAPPTASASDTAPNPDARDTVTAATPTPEQIPGYEVRGVLGRGGFGIVFRARQLKLDRVVALKTVLLDGPNAKTAAARFEQEAVALARLAHPHIVAVYDSGHHDGRVFFAMELLDGEDLHRRLDRGPLGERAAWWVARQTAVALSHAAESGVFHRDIKPANLFLVRPPLGFPLPPGVPMVKVTDFGLALTKRTLDGADANRLTAAGVVLGTPVYMAPEQFADSTTDHRADIYALGATVYHMLAGRPPFDGGTVWEVMLKKTEPPPPLGPGVSPESAALVAAMLAEKPADRVGSYEELVARIDALPCMAPAETPPAARQPPPAPRKRRRWVYAAAAAGGLAVAGVLAVAGPRLWGPKPDGPGPAAKGTDPPARYASSGFTEALFDGESVKGWIGTGWGIALDDEKNKVLTGGGSVRRPLPQPLRKHYRVQFGLDLHEAAAADVVVAVGDGPAETAPRWVLRVTRTDGAVFGRREGGERGKFEPLAAPVPYPTPVELENVVPYQNVRFERAGGRVSVAFRERPAGTIEDADKLRVSEIRLLVEGGPVRIESPVVEELVEQR